MTQSSETLALRWWSSLSINEQKAASKKHLLSYEYAYIWDYGYAKHVSRSMYIKLRVKVWEGEKKPLVWYELLINGYSWFTTQLEYTSDIKLANEVGGELSEGRYTSTEVSQIRRQLDDYQKLGFNTRLIHLKRNGVYQK